jgi:hypothetical protein
MLCVGGARSAAEGQQTSAALKAIGHLATGARQTMRFAGKERFGDLVPRHETPFHEGCQFARSDLASFFLGSNH